VFLDTGPLVAALDKQDRHHDWARRQCEELPAPLLTCEAVIAEACSLLRRFPGGPAAVLALLWRGLDEAPGLALVHVPTGEWIELASGTPDQGAWRSP
jgi:predicted nucleic acid-binding protein